MNKINLNLAKKDAFVVTKPIQYINVLNITSSNKRILLLVDLFFDSSVFFERVKKLSNQWDESLYFRDMAEAFNWLHQNQKRIASLYIDSDINNRKHFSRLSKLDITIYEEGIGTYCRVQYKPRRKIIGKLYLLSQRIRGYKNRRGGNKHTKAIIVYFPVFYKNYINEYKKKILGFSKPFIEHIMSCEELQVFDLDIDLSDYKNKVIALYLPDWEVHEDEIKKLEEIMCEKRIIKPHPHNKNVTAEYKFDLMVPGHIPAEIFIIKLLEFAKKIYLVSRYSTSTIYFTFSKNIEIINMPLATVPYEDTESYLDAYLSLTEYISKEVRN